MSTLFLKIFILRLKIEKKSVDMSVDMGVDNTCQHHSAKCTNKKDKGLK